MDCYAAILDPIRIVQKADLTISKDKMDPLTDPIMDPKTRSSHATEKSWRH